MLELISNVLNLIVSISSATASAEPPPLTYYNAEGHFHVAAGKELIFREESIYPGLPKVVREGRVGDERFALVEVSYGDSCPAEYKLLTVHDDGSHQEHRLGNCMSAELSDLGDHLEIRFPGFEHPDLHPPRIPEAWAYEDGQLRRLER